MATTRAHAAPRDGITGEVSVGASYFWIADQRTKESGIKDVTGPGVGINVAVGRWLAPRKAISVRLASIFEAGESVYLHDYYTRIVSGSIGPYMQWWPSERLWVGAGVGLGYVLGAERLDLSATLGFAATLRAGFTIEPAEGRPNCPNAWSIGLELAPSTSPQDGDHKPGIAIGFQVMYQRL